MRDDEEENWDGKKDRKKCSAVKVQHTVRDHYIGCTMKKSGQELHANHHSSGGNGREKERRVMF